jgi:hypothetical protein
MLPAACVSFVKLLEPTDISGNIQIANSDNARDNWSFRVLA